MDRWRQHERELPSSWAVGCSRSPGRVRLEEASQGEHQSCPAIQPPFRRWLSTADTWRHPRTVPIDCRCAKEHDRTPGTCPSSAARLRPLGGSSSRDPGRDRLPSGRACAQRGQHTTTPTAATFPVVHPCPDAAAAVAAVAVAAVASAVGGPAKWAMGLHPRWLRRRHRRPCESSSGRRHPCHRRICRHNHDPLVNKLVYKFDRDWSNEHHQVTKGSVPSFIEIT